MRRHHWKVSVSTGIPPRRDPQRHATVRLRELALADHDSVYHAPRAADWVWLILFAVVVLSCGAYIWAQLGGASVVGRAIFFAGALLAVLWAALVYTFKLSVSVAVGPRGLSLVRGPWRSELPWTDVGRLVERSKPANGQTYRWVVALGRDGRNLLIREDMVSNYSQFRIEVYQRYQLWQDHGGTWGTTGGGPFSAREDVAGSVIWWFIGAGATLLPGLYFTLLIPDWLLLGAFTLLISATCGVMGLWTWLNRQTYAVDQAAVSARRILSTTQLAWSEVSRAERLRPPGRLVIHLAIFVGRALLALAARTDGRFESFKWSPRIPEYLVLRGGGRQIRIRLHRLARPDELLAWIEFYQQVAQHKAQAQASSRTPATSWGASHAPVEPFATPDLSDGAGPNDPWAGGRAGAPDEPEGATPGAAGIPANDWPAPPSAPTPPEANTSDARQPSPRVTKKLDSSSLDQVDPRILAMLFDDTPQSGTPGVERGGRSDWLNHTSEMSPFRRFEPPASPTDDMPTLPTESVTGAPGDQSDDNGRPPAFPRYGPTTDRDPDRE